MKEIKPLPACIFPPVSWFLAGAEQGEFNVAMGGNYQKQTYQNHYHIAGPNGLHKLIIPVEHNGSKKLLKNAAISHTENWPKLHISGLKSAYGKAPFFEFYDYKIFPLLLNKYLSLAELIQASITLLHGFFLPHISLVFSDHSYSTFEFPVVKPYPQVFETKLGFNADMSALDLLFNLGPEAGDYLMGKYEL